jgi:glucokinase
MNYYLGIDIGATNVKHMLIDNESSILENGTRKTKVRSYENFLDQISIVMEEYKNDKNRIPRAVGVVVPGFIDFIDRKIVYSPNLHILNNRSIWDDFKSILSPIKFSVDNDANAAAYGEFVYRREKHSDLTDLVLITLGSGVGGGVIIDGKLLHGSRGFGAELGHIKILIQGRMCGCGSTGCAEAYLSNYGIVNTYKEELKSGLSAASKEEIDIAKLTARKIAELAFKGDENASVAMYKTGERLGQLISILINIFNPQVISIGGGIMDASDLLLPPAITVAREKSIDPSFRTVDIDKAVLGSEAGAYGAAMLAKDFVN